MPIYEYQCSACGHRLEILQRMSEDPLSLCPSCGAEKLQKLISAAGFRLKGGGWYETDFKGSGRRYAADGDGAAPDKGAAGPGDGATSGNGAGSQQSAAGGSEAAPGGSGGDTGRGAGEGKRSAPSE